MSLASQLSDGQGGLQFTAQAPPGIGRLIRIPFYLTVAAANMDPAVPGTASAVTYSTALGTASAVDPVLVISNSAINIGANGQLITPAISWATLRIVGFEASISMPKGTGAGGLPQVVFQDLQIGGGANLFIHEDWGSAALYASSNDNFAGLRDYPLLKSPNTARVTVACSGNAAAGASAGGTALQHCLLSANLVCEILQDDNYGSHVPGPYARKGAMVRRGGSFVS
jgi:hypothetical protein